MSTDPQHFNNFCFSSFPVLPSKKSDFKSLNLPYVISLSPFLSSKSDEIGFMPFVYASVPKCFRCNSTFFSKSTDINRNGKITWTCPVCKQTNVFTSSYLKSHHLDISKYTVLDFANPTTTLISKPKTGKKNDQKASKKQTKISLKPKNSLLFIIELTSSTKSPIFFHESLKSIKDQSEIIEQGDISIFLVNSHLHFPIISNNSVSLSSLYEFDSNFPFPPLTKLFFHLPEQKSLLQSFLNHLEILSNTFDSFSIDIENPLLSLFNLMKTLIPIIKSRAIHCIFIASRIVKFESISDYKNLILSNINSVYHFDFFLIENSSSPNFENLRELIFITNGYFNIYKPSSARLLLFSNDLSKQLNSPPYSFIEAVTIVPNELKIVDIHGCGVRTGLNQFSMNIMNPTDSIYYILDYAKSEIELNKELTIQFQIFYYDSSFNKRVRIINHQILIKEGIEMALHKANVNVLLSGCINHSIDKAREEEKIEKAFELMSSFSFDNWIRDSSSFIFNSTLKESMNKLKLPLFWPFLLGKMPLNIQMAIEPFVFKLSLGDLNLNEPYLFTHYHNFNNGIYLVMLPFNNNLVFVIGEQLISWEEIECQIQKSFPDLKIIRYESVINEDDGRKVPGIINSLFLNP